MCSLKNSIVVFLILYSSTFLSNNLYSMIYSEGKVDLKILVDDYRNAKVMEKCLLYMSSF
jgi:hypothetical protein